MVLMQLVATPSVPQLTVRKLRRLLGVSGLASLMMPYSGRSELAKPGAPVAAAVTMLAPPGAAGSGPLPPSPPDWLSSTQGTPSATVKAYQAPSCTANSEGFAGANLLISGSGGGSA